MEALIACLEKRQEERTEDELETITTNLKKLRVLRNFPESFLEELSLYAVHRNCPDGTTLLSPGQPITQWCAVIHGLLKVECSRNHRHRKQMATSMYELREGSSFGESCIFGERFASQSITCIEQTDLLCIDAESMKKVIKVHNGVLNSCLFSPDPHTVGSSNVKRRSTLSPNHKLFSDVRLAGLILGKLILTHEAHPLSDVTIGDRSYSNSCSGRSLVDWILGLHFFVPLTRNQAVGVGQTLLDQGVIQKCSGPKHGEMNFRDDHQTRYHFQEELSPDPMASIDRLSPISSLETEEYSLEDCLDVLTYSAPAPDAFTKALRKPRPERSPRDVRVILEELQHISGFDVLSISLKEKIAQFVQLVDCPTSGNFVFREGDMPDAWYVILRGSVNVLQGDDIVCTLHEEHSFGKEAVTSREPRSTSVQLREDGCLLLRVDKRDYKLALHSLHVSTFIQHGLEILLEPEVEEEEPEQDLENVATVAEPSTGMGDDEVMRERGVLDGQQLAGDGRDSDKNQTSTDGVDFLRPRMRRYMSVKHGSIEGILDHLVAVTWKDMFVEDFFLTFPAFMSTASLCEGLLYRYRTQQPQQEEVDALQDPNRERRTKENIVKHVLLWIQLGGHELITSPQFLNFSDRLQDLLLTDGFVQQIKDVKRVMKAYDHHPTYNIVHLNRSFSPGNSPIFKSKSGDVPSIIGAAMKSLTLSRSPRRRQRRLSIPSLSPIDPTDKEIVLVHSTVSSRAVRVQRDSTVKKILREACKELDLSEEEHQLCEVKSDGRKVVLKSTMVSITSKLSTNSKLFVLHVSTSETRKMPELVLPEQNQPPVLPFPIDSDVREIAAHLVAFDWNLFLNVQQMEFIYHAFEIESAGRVATNLDILSRRYNEVYAWVITVVCQEKDLNKRSHIIQKFIKIATQCLHFKDFNSFLAIVIALDSPAITRLNLTWKSVPGRLRREYERLKEYTAVDRNFKRLREHIRQQEAPLVPCIAVVLRDEANIHINNKTFNGSNVNFEKMHMMATSVRTTQAHKRGVLPEEIDQLTSKTPSLHYYIRNLKVIDNDRLQIEMSLAAEPKTKPQT